MWPCWHPGPAFAGERDTVGVHLASREEEGPPLRVGGGGLGRIREGRLRFLPGLPEPPCTARAAPSFLHPRDSGHLKISSVRQGRSLAVHSGPASLCSTRAAQATTVCPGRWGGRWGHPGQPPWESSGSGSPPWVHAGPTSVSSVRRPSFGAPQRDDEARPFRLLFPAPPYSCSGQPFSVP